MKTKDKLQGILMAYGLHGIGLKYATSDILSLFGVSNSLDLVELEKKIDKALDSETSESLKKWLHSKRL